MKSYVTTSIIMLLLLTGCSEDKSSAKKQETTTAKEPADKGHGIAVSLGTLTVGGKQFEIVRLGEIAPGNECAFEVRPEGMSAAAVSRLNVYLWVESQDGTQLSASAKGSVEGSALHFHLTPRKGSKEPVRVVLRLREGGMDERSGLPLDGHGHEHVEGPHAGVPATFTGGGATGWLELKLHDDKGDLELWLTEDGTFKQPFDLPLDGSIELEFIDVQGRKVSLRPRNTDRNEDEDGNPNIRSGKTNYFIYPSRSGEDASWLRGKEFQSIVVVRFRRGSQQFVSEEFVLKPHVH